MSVWFRIVRRQVADSAEVLRSGNEGRFHQGVDEPTSYAAQDLLTAWLEVTTRLGVPADPKAFRAVEITLRDRGIVDARDLEMQAAENISAAELNSIPASERCRQLGRRLRRRGNRALIYESVREKGGVCVAIFLENLGEKDISWRGLDQKRWQEFLRNLGL